MSNRITRLRTLKVTVNVLITGEKHCNANCDYLFQYLDDANEECFHCGLFQRDLKVDPTQEVHGVERCSSCIENDSSS